MPGQVTPEQAVLMLCVFVLVLAVGAWLQDRWHARRAVQPDDPDVRVRGWDPWEWDVDAWRELPWRPAPGERPVPLRADATPPPWQRL